jgi:hypothetical protein
MFNSPSTSEIPIWTVLVIAFFLSGCSSASELFRESHADDTVNVEYSVVYYIHADADYLYHDTAGEPVRENKRVLETALKVAETAKSGEVFIFHQRRQRKLLGLFPRNNNRFYHYINGKLVSEVTYRHTDRTEDFLTTEARLFNQYRIHTGEKKQRNYFLFFGHELPTDNRGKYHLTRPAITVNTTTFTAGIQKFLVTDEQRFNLVVLSTCNNGTPAMAYQLMPFSDVLLASPQNLHLSHIDSNNLRLMEISPDIPSVQLGHSIADQTYRRLETEIYTAITLSVYDLEVLQKTKSKLRDVLVSYINLDQTKHYSDNIDCKQLAYFDENAFSNGLRTWYKPARFGRYSKTTVHSGWGCKQLSESGTN